MRLVRANKSHLRNQKEKKQSIWTASFFRYAKLRGDLSLVTFEVMSSRSHRDPRANNLRASKNLLNDGFCVAKHHKARSRQSRRLAKAIGDDYATGAVGHEVQIPSPQPEKEAVRLDCFFLSLREVAG